MKTFPLACVIGLGLSLTVPAASLGPAVICAGAARLDNGSVVTIGQPLAVTVGPGTGVSPGIWPVFQATTTAHPPFGIRSNSTWATNGFAISLESQPGRAYVLRASTNLVEWTPIQTNRATGNSLEFRDAASGRLPWRFYRVSVE